MTGRFTLSNATFKGKHQIVVIDHMLENRYRFNKDKFDTLVLDGDDIYGFDLNSLDEISMTRNMLDMIDESKTMPLGTRKKFLVKNSVKSVKLIKTKGYIKIKYAKAVDKLKELNIVLKLKCDNLKLVLNNFYEMEGDFVYLSTSDNLLLCLYDRDECISSIMLKQTGPTKITIDSQTREDYEGRKYNKLLRAVSVIISNLISNDDQVNTTIESMAINPISSWLLINNFDVSSNEAAEYLVEFFKSEMNITLNQENVIEEAKLAFDDLTLKSLIFKFYNKYGGIDVTLQLTDHNIKRAVDLFFTLVMDPSSTGITC